jgi:hypothetical protein
MKKIAPGALAALVASMLLAAPAPAGPTVTVRVEGASSTLLERTAVTLPDTDSLICGAGKRWTVADAVEAATGGNWDRQPFTQTILGETHNFSDSDYWALWNGTGSSYSYSQTGICDTVMSEGQEALFLVDRTPPPDFAFTSFPLALRLPAAVQAGAPVSALVLRYAVDGSATPVEGATVAGGGATAVTGADGLATIVFPEPGDFAVKATKPGLVVSAGERVRVSTTPPAQPCQTSGSDGRCGTTDSEAPLVTVTRPQAGNVYSRRRAPRRIAGTVAPDPSGLKAVRLGIVRRVGDRCWRFSGASERFVRRRCGSRRTFRIGDAEQWSYLLPSRLPRGRYTIRAVAIDDAGNASRDRVVIRVR